MTASGVSVSPVPECRTPDRTVRDALTLGVTVVVFGVSYGVLGAAAEMSPILVIASSVLVFAGGAQFAYVGVLAAGGNPWVGTAAGLLLNARLAAFGLAASQHLATRSRLRRLIAAHLLTDETAAMALAHPPGHTADRAFWWVGLTTYVAWITGTALGALGGARFVDPAAFGLDAAFPAAYLSLLADHARGDRDQLRSAAVGGMAALVALPIAPPGAPMLIAACVALIVPSLTRGSNASGDEERTD